MAILPQIPGAASSAPASRALRARGPIHASILGAWGPWLALVGFLAALFLSVLLVASVSAQAVRPPEEAVVPSQKALPITPPTVRPPGVAPKPLMGDAPQNTLGDKSDSDIWRAIREGVAGKTFAPRPDDGMLIEGREPPFVKAERPEIFTRPPPADLLSDFTRADWWARIRNAENGLPRIGGYFLGVVLSVIVLFAFIRGPIPVEGGFSGRKIRRFRLSQRVVHWSIAIVFILMALTGLTILLGRPFLEPLIGKEAVSVLATASMQAHNLFGPVLIVLLVMLFVTFLPGNFPNRTDIVWLVKGGGFFGGHAPAGRYNLGEKGWFWTATIIGALLGATGIIMLFPDDLGTRALLEISVFLHGVGALIVIAYLMGHIYLGTYGTEGTLEGMVTGCVDENWAKTHHELWLRDLEEKGKIEECRE